MSKQVDERVVSMQFDNKHFEANVKQSMSTLDKLKAKLSLKGSAKAAESEFAAYKSGFVSFRDSLNKMWSTWEYDLANRMKRIVSMFTVDPLKTGFSEYELKMNSIQTIMASTGESLETVNKYLNDLNEYSDKTIYSFSDMTQNIGKFTNAGVKLEDAVLAIKGISNEAALSGANANEASRAMYNFAQALSVGYIQRIDWKSIELANMATVDFKENLLNAAVAAGTVKKNAKGMYATLENPDKFYNSAAMFTETLDDQWLTTEVLIGTLKDYADETTEVGKKATKAATEVKTFTQLMDTLKESAQSGWAQTWEIIFGDFNEGKKLWTSLSDAVGGFIEKTSKIRNDFLGRALGTGGEGAWSEFNAKIEKAGVTSEQFNEKLKKVAKEEGYAVDELIKKHGSLAKAITKGDISTNVVVKTLKELAGAEKETGKSTEDMTDKLEYFQKVVNEVWRGDYANGEARVKALTEAGYDYAEVQKLVNKTVDGHKLTLEDLSDAQLKSVGYTEEQIKTIRELADEAEKSGTDLNTLISQMNKPSGRELLIDTFANALQGLGGVLKSVKQAWMEIFSPSTTAEKASTLYRFLETLNKLSEHLRVNDDTAKKFVRTFKGVFAILDLIFTLVAGPFKIAFKLLTAILAEFDLDILDLTAYIGDALVGFRNWVKGLIDFKAIAEKIVPPIKNAIKAFKEWITSLKESDNIPRDIIKGLIKGLGAGIKGVVRVAMELGTKIIEVVKKVLGIHSPSWEFFEIGKNIILGLIEGLRDGASLIWNLIKTIGGKAIEMVGDLDLGTLITAGLSTGVLIVIKNIASAISALAEPLDGLGDMMRGVGKMTIGLGKMFKAKAFEIKAKAIIKFAIAIAILAGAVALLSLIEPGKLWNAVGAVAVLTVLIGALAFLLSKMNSVLEPKKIISSALSIASIGLALLMIAGALALFILVIKQIGKLKEDVLVKGMGVIATFGVFFAIFARVIGQSGQYAGKVGRMMFKMSLSLLLLVFVIKQIDKLDERAILNGIVVISAFGLMFQILTLTIRKSGQYAAKIGTMLIRLSLALLLMTFVIKQIDGLDDGAITKGYGVISSFAMLLAAFSLLSSHSGQYARRTGAMLLSMAGSMFILVYLVKMINKLDEQAISKGLNVIIKFGLLFATLILVTKNNGQNAHKVGSMLLMMSGAIFVLVGVMFILDKLETSAIVKGMFVILGLGTMFRLLIRETANAQDCMRVLITLGVIIALLVGAVIGLSFMDPMKLMGATLAVSILVGVFALLVHSLSKARNTKPMRKTLVQLMIIVGLLTAFIVALAFLEQKGWIGSALKTSGSIAILLTSFAISIAILSKAGRVVKTALKAMGPMYLVVLGLSAIVVGLGFLQRWIDVSLDTVLGISILLIAMSASMVLLSKVKQVSKSALIAMGVLTAVVALLALILAMMTALHVETSLTNVLAISMLLMVMVASLRIMSGIKQVSKSALIAMGVLTAVVALLALILAMMTAMHVENAIGNAIALSVLLIAMSLALNILTSVGMLAPFALVGIDCLIALILKMAVLITAIGALVKFFPALETFLDKGIPILEKIGYALGSFLGNIIGGLMSGIASGLPEIGTRLSEFMYEATPFINGVNLIGENFIKNIASLTGGILLLTAADLITGITDFMSRGCSLALLGAELSMFMHKATPFIAGISTLNPDMMAGVKTLAQTILILTAANLLEGLTRFFGNESSLASFGAQLPILGTHISQFVTNLGTFGEAQVTTVTCAANAIKNMAQAADAIPNEGGWLAKIVGDNSISTFGAYLPALGTHVSQFAANLGTFGEAQVDSVTCAANAVKGIAEAADKIPNEGGWWGKITGDNSISTFGGYLPGLGANLAGFVANLGTFGEAQITTTKCAAEAIKGLAQASEHMPESGGFWAKIVGDKQSLEEFGGQLPKVGTYLKDFIVNLGKFDSSSVETTKAAVKAIEAFAELGTVDLASLSEDLPTFGDRIVSFAGKIKSFGSEMGTVNGETLSAAIGNVDKILDMFRNIESVNSDAAIKFGESLTTLGKTGVSEFISAFQESAEDVKTVGRQMMDNLVSGISEKTSTVKTNFTNIATACVSALNDKYQSFYDAGSYLVDGFCAGISENDYKAVATVRAMGRAVANAAEEELDINSPSKVFRAIGTSIPEGFAMGIDKLSGNVANSSVSMADVAVDGVRESIAHIADIINSDMDTQPTIRPVLDLSDVRAGANAIGGMFGTSIGVLSNVKSIGSAMNRKNQNGGNDDIISAIDKLRDELSNLDHASYTINGITYSGDDELADALETIVRAARVERRT